MPLTRRTALTVLAVTFATVGLAGCGTTSDPASSSPTTEWVGPTNPVVPPAPANGEVLTTDDQLEGARIAGFTVYEMADGSKVAVDPAQDLPQQVADEGIADAQARWQGDILETSADANGFVQGTGKNVVFIVPVYGSKDGETYEMLWLIAGLTTTTSQFYTPSYPGFTADPAVQVTYAQQWIAEQPDAATWQILVVPAP